MELQFEKLATQILNEISSPTPSGEAAKANRGKDRGEHESSSKGKGDDDKAGNFAVVENKHGKFARIVKTFDTAKQAQSYANKCNSNPNKKDGCSYIFRKN